MSHCMFFAEETPVQAIEEAFKRFTERDDVAIVLINQYVSTSLLIILPNTILIIIIPII